MIEPVFDLRDLEHKNATPKNWLMWVKEAFAWFYLTFRGRDTSCGKPTRGKINHFHKQIQQVTYMLNKVLCHTRPRV